MFWLFAQMFVLCGFAFLAGAVLTWLPLRATIRTLRSELTLTRPTTRPALPPATVVIPPQPKPAPELEVEPEPEAGAEVAPETVLVPGLEATLEVAPEASLVPPPAPATPAPAPAVLATDGPAITAAVHPHTAPVAAEVVGVVVKGSSKSMIFHTPDSPYFKRMKGDVTFRSIAEAEEAGYTRWRPKTAAASAR
ncbi:MAG: hypothetical protein HOY78_06205 [Saccharothrix sp.]|nr:hypothetical protein [Saccharothrix sp.]